LLTKKPHQVKFVLIDPKRVELSVYDELPHLLTPVVTDPRKASQALMWVVQEMEKRYQLLAKKGVRNITQYNKKIKTSKDEDKELPFVVIVIDELADLMMVASKDVEDSICRIAQMGRAAGIHLVIGTQRPSVDVITGLIKANIPARIAFAVSSSVDSRTILDMSGAERLLGNGDMLYMPPGLNKPIRVQGSYISESEINKISQFIKDQKDANYAKENFNKSSDTVTSVLEDRDELFEEALLEFIDYGSASISLLQRRFRIGYTRAARIVDQLEEAGAISGYAGSKPRDVLMESKIVKELINNNDK
jgi:S-DNA-T family DNA segregation ATPase FtsK/SpoIIIE